MADTFNCPNCNAPLEAEGASSTIRCPYCGTSVIVPQELRFNQPDMPEATELQSGDLHDLMEQLRSGNKIEAIRIYRRLTGVGLAEAKAAVEAIEAGNPLQVFKTVHSTPVDETTSSTLSTSTSDSSSISLYAEISQLARSGQKIEAIKTLRLHSGLGLKEAKEIVDAMERGEQPPLGSLSVQPSLVGTTVKKSTRKKASSSSGCSSMTVLFFVIILPVLIALAGVGAGVYAGLPRDTQNSISDFFGQYTNSYARVVLRFGKEGTGPGLFNDARSIAVDKDGNIYAADYQGGRMQVFDSTGEFLRTWNLGKSKAIIEGMAVDRKGILYVVSDGYIYRYQASSGSLIDQEFGKDPADGNIYFEDIDVSADNSVIAVSRGEDIYKFDSDGSLVVKIPAAISTVSGDSELDSRLAVDGQNTIYAIGTFNNAVFKFSPQGKFINRFGSEGDQPGQFEAMYAVASDGQGRVYVSDINGIQVFDSSGRFLKRIDIERGVAFGMAFDDQNNLYVISSDDQVVKLALRSDK